MKVGFFLKVLSVLLGALLAISGAGGLLVLSVGTFDQGRGATMLMCVMSFLASAAFLALPFWPRVGRALGVVAAVVLAGTMLRMVFDPALAAAKPGVHQAAAIALAVLLLARLVSAFRRRRLVESLRSVRQ